MLSEHPMLGKRGMVATAHYLATRTGLHILTQGGNAIDAAIAAAFAMTVVDVTEAVVLEEGFPASTLLALGLLGHHTIIGGPWKDGIGHVQIITINADTHVFEGATNLRCDGLALGW